MTSCTLPLESMAQPVARQAITSLWSPKMLMAWVPTVRLATWSTAGSREPAIRYITGIISISPWAEVKLTPRDPASQAPWTAPMAPASDCISTSRTGWPNRFFRPWALHSSVCSAMGEEGVMG